MSGRKGRDTAALVLLGLSIIGGVVMLFYRPFGLAIPVFLCALIGVGMSSGNRRFGLATTMFVTLCFLIGTSFAIWNSNALY